nr:hypothetical protein [Tanacetum cinerariifolium]
MTHGPSVPPLVIKDLCLRMDNLEFRHGALVKKMGTMSDSQMADSIVVGEIWPRVAIVEGHVQVESRVDTHPNGHVAMQGQDVIIGLSQQVPTLQTSLHRAELQNHQ